MARLCVKLPVERDVVACATGFETLTGNENEEDALWNSDVNGFMLTIGVEGRKSLFSSYNETQHSTVGFCLSSSLRSIFAKAWPKSATTTFYHSIPLFSFIFEPITLLKLVEVRLTIVQVFHPLLSLDCRPVTVLHNTNHCYNDTILWPCLTSLVTNLAILAVQASKGRSQHGPENRGVTSLYLQRSKWDCLYLHRVAHLFKHKEGHQQHMAGLDRAMFHLPLTQILINKPQNRHHRENRELVKPQR